MKNKNGIPVVMPKRSNRKTHTSQNLHNDFERYKKFATMIGFEKGYLIMSVVPIRHQDFRNMKKQGCKVVEVWDKKGVI